ncbi:MAG: NrfD/PsrC family molybdoenzyme membrane anchor subunit [Caldilineaceae bacterium]
MTARALTQPTDFRIGPFRQELVVVGLLACLTAMGVVAGLGRLFLGLAASTALNDTTPWGIWIGFDFTLIAVAGVGFTMAFLVHVLHLHQLRAVLRSALLAGLMGYVAVLLLLVLDLGRPDRFYHFILFWNLHSPLFEISWCVLLYTTVLIIEVSPDLLRWLGWQWLLPWVTRLMTPVTILGVTLSTLHQSTLGTLYLNMPHRLDPLWYTPYLPLLFLVSAVMVGFSLGMLTYQGTCRILKRRVDPLVIALLGRGMSLVAGLYLALKLSNLAWEGELGRLTTLNRSSLLLGSELLLGVVLPLLIWWLPGWRYHKLVQWVTPLLILFGVSFNRFNATMFAQQMATASVYSPHILEWVSTIGILAAAGLGWYLGVRYLVGGSRRGAHP